MLINIVHPILSEDRKNIDYTLKLLIPANYVTKLIGQSNVYILCLIIIRGLHDQRYYLKVWRCANKNIFG